jgi:hypothetical protein
MAVLPMMMMMIVMKNYTSALRLDKRRINQLVCNKNQWFASLPVRIECPRYFHGNVIAEF